MIRKIAKMTACFAAAAFALTLGVGAITASENKADLTISDIMKKGHAKTGGTIANLKAAVKDKKWDDAKKAGAELKTFGDGLPGLKPPKGDDASWKKLAGEYKANTNAAAAAADKMDAEGVTKALTAIGGSCGGCHKVHK